MESKLRKPLVTQNGSRLQAPSSRLKAPSSFTSKLATATKRSRSPDEAPSAKRQRTVVNENSATSTATRSTTLRTSNSTGNLNSAASKKLKTNTSGSNLRTGMAPGVGSRTAKTTATVKPSVVKPPKPAPSTRPPAARASNNGRGSNSSSAPPASTGGRPKRAAWDLKGRLQDMEEEMRVRNGQREDFTSQMLHYNERIASLENTNMQLSGTVAQKEEHAFAANKEKDDLRQKLRNVEDNLDETRRKLERDTENFEFTKASLRRQKDSLESELSAMQQEVTGLKSSVAQLTSSQAGLNSELEATKLALERSTKNEERLQKMVDERDVTIEDFNCKFREHESIRRQLHNLVQELKGNIRVFCRVRPLLGEELLGNDGEIHHMSFPDDDQKSLELERLADVSLSESTIGGARKGNGRYGFSFDRVFGPASSQAEVFDEISQLVQSAMDGYNVCIFAYGQTGSGKTFTMEGPSVVDDESRGMISRAVLQIFTSTKELEDKGWQYEFEASFLEIYNETIRDLLGNHGNDVKHEIKLGTNGNDVSVTNLMTVPVASEDQISDLLKTASNNRAVGETHCNERSSRSHSVFRLKITGSNDITSEQCKGTLNLVDLAGSERLKESGATGQRLKETQNINKSLSNLGNVIMALGNKESHIPYRNSRLTYLLQNSLGGNSKTLMFVNVSPREENFSETLNSLRFATKVNQCNIGTATKKTK